MSAGIKATKWEANGFVVSCSSTSNPLRKKSQKLSDISFLPEIGVVGEIIHGSTKDYKFPLFQASDLLPRWKDIFVQIAKCISLDYKFPLFQASDLLPRCPG